MSQSLHPMLNIAIKAARAAGAIINRGSQDLDLLKVTNKGPNDFVTEIDQVAEQAIIDILLTAYPGHGILAEESGRTHGSKDSEFTWIIDPLDGTTNFMHGFPVYAVSIALAFRGVVQQAVVYDPNRNDLFYASRGRGAFLNDKRLRVSKRVRLADSLIGTGFPFRKGDSFQRYVKMFETVMQACAGLRRPGAAALDLCYVAAGWYDGFFETGLNPWDLAAGSLIITEAGGLVGNFTGESDFLFQREVVAGNPKVYGQLVALLAPYTKVIKDDDTVDGDSLSELVAEAGMAPAASTATSVSDAAASAMIGSFSVGAAGDKVIAAKAGKAAAKSATAPDNPPASTGTVNENASAPGATPERERQPIRIRKIDAPADAGPQSAPWQNRGDRGDRPPQRGGPRPDSRGDFRGGDRGPQGGGGGGDRGGERWSPSNVGPSGPSGPVGPVGPGGPFKPRRKPGDSSY